MNQADYGQRLIAAARPYWAAEAAVTRRFFDNGPSREDWIYYLKSAVYKELNPAIGYGPTDGYANGLHMEFAQLVEKFPRLDRDVDRHAFYTVLHQMTEEFNHYLVLADVLEYLLGRKLTPDDPEQREEDRKLNEMRRRYVTSGDPVLKAAMMLTEGGGSSTFREASKLAGGELERRIASAMKVIYDDEVDHYEDAAAGCNAVIASEADFERARKALVEVSLQRVRMRHEQFREPMPWSEVEAVIAKSAAGGG